MKMGISSTNSAASKPGRKFSISKVNPKEQITRYFQPLHLSNRKLNNESSGSSSTVEITDPVNSKLTANSENPVNSNPELTTNTKNVETSKCLESQVALEPCDIKMDGGKGDSKKKRHRKKNRMKVNYSCQHCDEIFEFLNQFLRHMQTHSENENMCKSMVAIQSAIQPPPQQQQQSKRSCTESKAITPKKSSSAQQKHSSDFRFRDGTHLEPVPGQSKSSSSCYEGHVVNEKEKEKQLWNLTPTNQIGKSTSVVWTFSDEVNKCTEKGVKSNSTCTSKSVRRKTFPQSPEKTVRAISTTPLKSDIIKRSSPSPHKLVSKQQSITRSSPNKLESRHLHVKDKKVSVKRRDIKLPDVVKNSSKLRVDKDETLNMVKNLNPLNKQCFRCKKILTSTGMKYHVKNRVCKTIANTATTCEYCQKSFQNPSILKIHIRSHTGEKPFSCSYCAKKFACSSNLAGHRRTHTGEKPYKCKYCGKAYTTSTSLAYHVKLHESGKSLPCKYCNRMFEDSVELSAHSKKHVQEQQRPTPTIRRFNCKYCGKVYTSSSSLDYHIKLHESGKSHPCKYCNRMFENKSKLQAHTQRHAQVIRPYQCEYCTSKFQTQRNLTLHNKSHTAGNKPYVCKNCEKEFTSLTSYRIHLKWHQKGKIMPSHICKYCKKIFQKASRLKMHIMTKHNDAKPYQCKYCPKTFRLSSSMVSHTRRHTGEKPYSCKNCKKKFTFYSQWRYHSKKEHNE